MTFADDQFKAASGFVHTMIVVDDEPVADADDSVIVTPVRSPGRRDAVGKIEIENNKIPVVKRTHSLNAKELIKSALELGLVCSVVNPTGDEDNVAKSIARASIRADIISLDWHMNHNDEGALASEIIKEILVQDEEVGGRLRLIAIYTGNKDRGKIFDSVKKYLNEAEELSDQVVQKDDVLVNSSGLRLVWREKALLNTSLPNAISEAQLPLVLLKEFSKLSEGLLANVALATISSVRDSTHHLLNKFKSELDGPFFHHRALIKKSSDSMDYAVSVVLSALKSEVDKSQITSRYTTYEAVHRRLSSIEQSLGEFTLRYEHKKNGPKEFRLNLDDVLDIMENGFSKWPEASKTAAAALQADAQANPLPNREAFEKNFSSLFFGTRDLASLSMLHFSFLTSVQSSEQSKIHKKIPPKLELGSVLCSAKGKYILCLQATCDTVRGRGLFFFIPLEIDDERPDIVVPHGETITKPVFKGLTVPEKCYTQSRCLDFGAINDEVGHVPVCYDYDRDIFHVPDANGEDYRWLANLKYKRALRIAQSVSQEISRVGFDEFEPFRKA